MKVTVILTRAISVEFQRQKPESGELKRKLQSKETDSDYRIFVQKVSLRRGVAKWSSD